MPWVETVSRVLLVAAALVCFSSFAWAMKKLFRRPAGTTIAIILTSGCAVACALAHLFALSRPAHIHLASALVAALLYMLALAVFWWAVATIRRRPLPFAFTPATPAFLITGGPYRYVRHPFYTAYLLAWLAGIIGTGQPWLLLTLGIMGALYAMAARLEEAGFRASPLASAYATYRQSTGGFIPRIRTLFVGSN